MLKLNHVFLLPLLLVVALLSGVPGGAYAKSNPPFVPPGSLLVGPSVDGIMTFFVDGGVEKVSFVGSCMNVVIEETILFEWKKSGSPALEETDLVAQGQETASGNQRFGQVVKIDQQPLVGLLQVCYGDSATVFLLQFQNVHDFTEVTPDETYTAEVILKRLILHP